MSKPDTKIWFVPPSCVVCGTTENLHDDWKDSGYICNGCLHKLVEGSY